MGSLVHDKEFCDLYRLLNIVRAKEYLTIDTSKSSAIRMPVTQKGTVMLYQMQPLREMEKKNICTSATGQVVCINAQNFCSVLLCLCS